MAPLVRCANHRSARDRGSWHRAGFRLFGRWQSRQASRPKLDKEIRELIRRVKAENPAWDAPRLHGELLQLGFQISNLRFRATCKG